MNETRMTSREGTVKKNIPGVRHLGGCPIEGRQGYGCACNSIPAEPGAKH